MFSLANLKAHAEDFLHNLGAGPDHEYHKLLAGFATFLEGRQAEADAVALLQHKGYTVTAPPSTVTAGNAELPTAESAPSPNH